MHARKEMVQRTEDNLIYVIRGQKVMLDEDLARIYGVETRILNQAVKRNLDRFPEDFMFQMTQNEYDYLRSQFVISNLAENEGATNLKSQIVTSSWGGRRKLPFVFTEHGAVMLASVLNSPQAIHASIQVVKSFVRLRELLLANKDLARKLNELEKKYDEQFAVVFDAVRKLMAPLTIAPRVKKRIGYRRKGED